jgi:hypothetical protein
MQLRNIHKLLALAVLTASAAIGFACQKNAANKPATNAGLTNTNAAQVTPAPDGKPPTMTDYPVGNAQTPSEAYRMLFASVKSQDPTKIRSMLSTASLGLAEMASGQQKKTVEEVIKNGFTETSFAETMPAMRDERIKGGYAAVEVWNTTRKQWDDIPFVLEGGSWKAAFGDAFGGKWKSPGKSQTVLEQEAANAKNPNLIPYGNANTNANFRKIKPIVPKAK